MHSQQPPDVVQNWSTLQCSKQNTEQCGYDHAPVTRGRMRAQFPLPRGLGWRSSWSGVRFPVRLSVQGPVGDAPATAPFSIPLHHRYRRWIGGVSRPHSFFFVQLQGMSTSGCNGYEHRESEKSKAPTTIHLQQRAPPPVPLAPPEPHLLLIFLLSEESNLHLQGSGRLHCRCGTWPKRPHYAPQLLGMLCLSRWYAPEAGPAAPSQPHYRHRLCSQTNENEPNTHTHY